jgi:hypothetical protein
MQNITLHFHLRFPELLRVNLYLAARRMLPLLLLPIGFSLLPYIIEYVAARTISFNLETELEYQLPLLVILLLATITYSLVLAVGYYRRSAYFQDLSYEFSHWGLIATSAFSGSVPWRSFLGYKERPKFILLYMSKYRVISIPKRIFDSSEELETFRLTLRDNLPYYGKKNVKQL